MLPSPTPHFSVLCSLKADLPAVHGLVQKTTTLSEEKRWACSVDGFKLCYCCLLTSFSSPAPRYLTLVQQASVDLGLSRALPWPLCMTLSLGLIVSSMQWRSTGISSPPPLSHNNDAMCGTDAQRHRVLCALTKTPIPRALPGGSTTPQLRAHSGKWAHLILTHPRGYVSAHTCPEQMLGKWKCQLNGCYGNPISCWLLHLQCCDYFSPIGLIDFLSCCLLPHLCHPFNTHSHTLTSTQHTVHTGL